jgi:hypothetical protein
VLPCVDVFVANEFFVKAPILRSRLALRLGAQLVDMPCVCVADVCSGTQLADVPCVALGHPTCGRALRYVGAPKLGEVVLKRLPPTQNLFLSILQVIFYPSAPLWGRFRCGRVLRLGDHLAEVRTCPEFALRTCIGAPNLRTCLALRFGSQLADVPCVAFGHPSYGRSLRCVGVPKLGEAVLKSLPPGQNLFLSILQLVFYPSARLCGCFCCG